MSLPTPDRLTSRSTNEYQAVKTIVYETFPIPDPTTYSALLADLDPEKAAFIGQLVKSPEYKNPQEVIRLIESHLIAELTDAIISPERLMGRLSEKPIPFRQRSITRTHPIPGNGIHGFSKPPPRLTRIP